MPLDSDDVAFYRKFYGADAASAPVAWADLIAGLLTEWVLCLMAPAPPYSASTTVTSLALAYHPILLCHDRH